MIFNNFRLKMKYLKIKILTILFLLYLYSVSNFAQQKSIPLPKPSYKSSVSFEETIYKWKATRNFKEQPLNLKQISQLLWAAFGTTIDGVSSATRVFPSAGAIYPLDIYVVVGNVKELEAGIYKYDFKKHSIELIKKGDFRKELTVSALNQYFINKAPVSFIWTASYDKMGRYAERGKTRYIHIDLGHSAQNLTLQATALGLGTVQVGAFKDEEVRNLLGLPKDKTPVYIMPVGYPQ